MRVDLLALPKCVLASPRRAEGHWNKALTQIAVVTTLAAFVTTAGATEIARGFVYPVGVETERPTTSAGNPNGYRVSQGFCVYNSTWGGYHLGVDLGNGSSGGQVRACANGIVKSRLDNNATWGNYVRIEHHMPDGSTYWSMYAHMSAPASVSVGQLVSMGQPIGTVGMTGSAGGSPHLHFQIRNFDSDNGGYGSSCSGQVDPLQFIADRYLIQGTATKWDFNTTNDRDGWTSIPFEQAWSVGTGSMVVNNGQDTRIYSPYMNRTPNSKFYIKMNHANTGSCTVGQFYLRTVNTGWTADKMVYFTMPSGGSWKTTVIAMKDVPQFDTDGNWQRFRIQLVGACTGNSFFSYIYYVSDNIAPVISGLTGSPGGWTRTNSFSVSWSGYDGPDDGTGYGSGVAKYEYRLNGGAWVDVGTATSVQITNAVLGDNTLEVRGTDRVGNVGSAATTHLYLDTAAPPQVAQPAVNPPAWTATNSFAFSWSAVSDPHSGVNRYEYRIDSGTVHGVGTALSVSAIQAPSVGTHGFEVRAVDNVGNAGSWSPSRSFSFDNVAPPTVSQPSVDPVEWTAINAFAFSWNAVTDATSGVHHYEYRIDGGAPVSTGTNRSVSGPLAPSPAVHSLAARAVDNAGNQGSWSTSRDFKFDNVPPDVPGSLVAAPGGYSSVNDFTVTWSGALDAHSGTVGYDYRVNGGGVVATSQLSVTGALATQEGENLFDVRARDLAGNVSAWSQVVFYYDASPPPAPVPIGSPDQCASTNSFIVAWEPVPDPQGILRYEVRVGGGAILPVMTTSIGGIALTEECGEIVEVRAVDGAGNAGPWGGVWLCWDGTPPGVPAPQVTPAGWSRNNVFTVGWEAVTDGCSGLDAYCVGIGSGDPGNCGLDLVASGALARFEGVDTVFVRSRDHAGNVSSAGLGLLHFDATAPEVHFAEPTLFMDVSEGVVVRWVGSDNASGVASFDVEMRDSVEADWHSLRAGTDKDTTLVSNGSPLQLISGHAYFLRARARDFAGNAGVFVEEPGARLYVVATTATDMGPWPRTGRLELAAGRPNPFRQNTTLEFVLPCDGWVSLRIYGLNGTLSRALYDGPMTAGVHSATWDGRDASGRPVSPGVYLCKLTEGNETVVRKLIMTR